MRWLVGFCLVLGVSQAMAQGSEDVLRPNGRSGDELSSRTSSGRLPIVLGIEGGINMNFYSQGISRAIDIDNSPEDVVKSGFGVSPEIGFFADFSVSKSFGFQVRAAYDAKSAGATMSDGMVEADSLIPQDIVQGTFPHIDATVESEFGVKSSAATIAVLGRLDLSDNLFVTLGPLANWALSDVTRTDRLKVLSPDSVFILSDYEGNRGLFTEISRESNLSQTVMPQPGMSEASTFSTLRLGIELGVGYRFMISKTVYIAPNLRYQYFFTPLTDSYQSLDNSRFYTIGTIPITYNKATLNSLALIVQLGFSI